MRFPLGCRYGARQWAAIADEVSCKGSKSPQQPPKRQQPAPQLYLIYRTEFPQTKCRGRLSAAKNPHGSADTSVSKKQGQQ